MPHCGHPASIPADLVETAAARANRRGPRKHPCRVAFAELQLCGGQRVETYTLYTCCQPGVHLRLCTYSQVSGTPQFPCEYREFACPRRVVGDTRRWVRNCDMAPRRRRERWWQ